MYEEQPSSFNVVLQTRARGERYTFTGNSPGWLSLPSARGIRRKEKKMKNTVEVQPFETPLI